MQTEKSTLMKQKRAGRWRADLVALYFILPFAVVYTIFTIYPVLQGVYMSFFKWTLMGKRGFVGADNWTKMLGDKFFWASMWNTTKFVLYSTPLIILSSLGLALLANRATPLKRLYRTVYFFPNLLSVSVISFITVFMCQPHNLGFISNLLHSMGVSQEFDIYWLNDKHLAWVTIVVATMWWTQGYNMMLFISAMQDIPDRLYESASIDGATPTQQLIHITLPMLKQAVGLVLMLQIIASFKVYAQIKLITGGGPGRATRPLIQYIYEQAFDKQNLGYASVMSFMLFLVLIILTLIQRKMGSGRDEQ